MNRIIVVKIAGLILLAVLVLYYWKNPLKTKVYFDGQIIYADVAVTSADKAKGLGMRKYMPENYGMLFVYNHKEIYPFWMKDMRFPLDFIWLDGTNIVGINENVPVMTNSQITIITPNRPVDKVLEVNAGTVRRLGIKVGDTVVIRN